ncbi:MAG TPA: hypothetical protein VGL35_10775 [Rhizomicrobium sp.]|jgi:hypothetical protein
MTPLSLSHLPPGAPWWILGIVVTALALHIGGGSIGIISGYTAVFVRKGAHLHRTTGAVFSIAMLAMGVMGASLAVWIGQYGNIIAGVLASYLVSTGWMTVKRQPGTIGRFELVACVAAFGSAALLFSWGLLATMSAKGAYQGSAAPFWYAFACLFAVCGSLDLNVILRRGIAGVARLARHLWRMCFGLFFAAASFFLGQQKVMPAFMHGSPLLFIPALAPLALMIYWLVRVRFSKWKRVQISAAAASHAGNVSPHPVPNAA